MYHLLGQGEHRQLPVLFFLEIIEIMLHQEEGMQCNEEVGAV